jgi:hypothetical protein
VYYLNPSQDFEIYAPSGPKEKNEVLAIPLIPELYWPYHEGDVMHG